MQVYGEAKTALDMAVEYGTEDMVKQLLDAGANVKRVTSTPFPFLLQWIAGHQLR